MTQTPSARTENRSVKRGVAAVTSIGAGILLTTVGLLELLEGIAAVAEDQLFVAGVEYIYKFDFATWGWVHIVLGVVLAVIGIALITGAFWARVAAVIIAALSLIANFLWLPYYPCGRCS